MAMLNDTQVKVPALEVNIGTDILTGVYMSRK